LAFKTVLLKGFGPSNTMVCAFLKPLLAMRELMQMANVVSWVILTSNYRERKVGKSFSVPKSYFHVISWKYAVVVDKGLNCYFANGGTCGFRNFGSTEGLWDISGLGADGYTEASKDASGELNGENTLIV